MSERIHGQKVTLECLNAQEGHATVITIEDNDPEKRAELAAHVTEMLKKGYAIMVTKDGGTFPVAGYDKDTNEWVLKNTAKKKAGPFQRMAAAATQAMGIPPRAGG